MTPRTPVSSGVPAHPNGMAIGNQIDDNAANVSYACIQQSRLVRK